MAPKAKKVTVKAPDKSATLILSPPPGKSIDAAQAEMAVAGLASNAFTAVQISSRTFGELGLTEYLTALTETVQAVKGGDLSGIEALLSAQAVTLNVIFTQFASRAALNMGEYLDAADRYMRLAVKAQGQCRATLETLATIKNPPVLFARQANIAHGPQQVNNRVPLRNRDDQPSSRAGKLDSEQTKLLEAHGEILDVRAAQASGDRDQAVATVGPFDGTPDASGQGAVGAKRVSRG